MARKLTKSMSVRAATMMFLVVLLTSLCITTNRALAALSDMTDNAQAQASTFLSAQAESAQLCMSVRVVGPDASGNNTEWLTSTTVAVSPDKNGWDASQVAFDAAFLTYDASSSTWGTSLNTISSPFTGEVLGWDAETGRYWQLFVDGKASDVGIDQVEAVDGRSIVWFYSSWGQSLDSAGEASQTQRNKPVFESSDVVPTQLEVDWPEFEAGGNVTQAPTGEAVKQQWATRVGGGFSVSELLHVGGKIYVAVGQSFYPNTNQPYEMSLLRIDAATGQVESSAALADTIDYTCRPIYADGIVYVPLAGGAVQAINASTMLSRWVSATEIAGAQASCSLRISEGMLYEGLAVYGSDWSISEGALWALDAQTGKPMWSTHTQGSGFYWTDSVRLDTTLIAGTTSGELLSLNAKTGKLLDKLALGEALNADISVWNNKLLVLTRDGTLHLVSHSPEGLLSKETQLKVLGGAKAAPTVVGNMALCAGIADDGATPALVLVDLAQMSVVRTITTADDAPLPSSSLGGISAPALISQHEGKTRAYFTVNHAVPTDQTWTSYSSGGNLYLYELGAPEAQLLWEPTGELAQACDSPVISDAAGALYYLNDSGYVAKLIPVEPEQEPTIEPKPDPEPDPKPEPNPQPDPAPSSQPQDKKDTGNTIQANQAQGASDPSRQNQTSNNPNTQIPASAVPQHTLGRNAVPRTGDATNTSLLLLTSMGIAFVALSMRHRRRLWN